MINISIVTYNTGLDDLAKLMKSFNESVKSKFKIFIVDNSKSDTLRNFFQQFDFVMYIHNPSNPGFGASHNIAIKKSIEENTRYHFVVNPDVYFTQDVISSMVQFAEKDEKVGMIMPQILNLDGSIQNLPKLLPSPFSVLLRKIKKPSFIYKPFIENYELRKVPTDIIYNAPILSGCFTLLKIDAIKKIGLYDDAFFMYFEDWDLSRRMNKSFKTIYYPLASVYHGYESGANKNKFLFRTFIKSAKHYFNKWGWLFDRERVAINKKTLEQFL